MAFKRLCAFVLDWYLSSLIVEAAIRLLSYLLQLPPKLSITSAYIEISVSLVVAFIYYVLLPYGGKTAGTLMMRLFNLAIVDYKTAAKPKFGALCKRFCFAGFLLQGYFYSQFTRTWENLQHIINVKELMWLDQAFLIVSVVCLLLTIYLGIKNKKFDRSIQDCIAQTKVIVPV